MAKLILIPILLLGVQTRAQSVIQSPQCNGVIRGAVLDRGKPVKGIFVVAWPLGIDLAAILPRIATDETGEYRLEHVWRYTVVVEDKKSGYPSSSPLMIEFLYGARVREVRLSPKRPQVELPVYLPPKPGLMQIHITNGKTKAEIFKFSVKLRVPGQRQTPEAGFEFDPTIEDHLIEVPPDKDVIFHVTAEGFQEWRESVGRGKVMRVPSGTQVALEVPLVPLK